MFSAAKKTTTVFVVNRDIGIFRVRLRRTKYLFFWFWIHLTTIYIAFKTFVPFEQNILHLSDLLIKVKYIFHIGTSIILSTTLSIFHIANIVRILVIHMTTFLFILQEFGYMIFSVSVVNNKLKRYVLRMYFLLYLSKKVTDSSLSLLMDIYLNEIIII